MVNHRPRGNTRGIKFFSEKKKTSDSRSEHVGTPRINEVCQMDLVGLPSKEAERCNAPRPHCDSVRLYFYPVDPGKAKDEYHK